MTDSKLIRAPAELDTRPFCGGPARMIQAIPCCVGTAKDSCRVQAWGITSDGWNRRATPTPVTHVAGEEALDWSNFEGPKRNIGWKPDDQDLIYTAINFRDDEWGDADEDAGQQIVERLLTAWKSSVVTEQLVFEASARLLRERDEARADHVAASEVTDFLYKHGDLTYSAAARAVQLLTGNGFGFTSASSERKSKILTMRKALNKIADMIDAEDAELDDAISIACAALATSEGSEG